MATRSTGFAILGASSVQEGHDLALIAQAATLAARVPFIHFTDGFRTSHEYNKMTVIPDEHIRAMIDETLVWAHRARALSPERPFVRGTWQNPDTYFQTREAVNPYYAKTPGIVAAAMDRFAGLTGRRYDLFRYDGPADAERVIVSMGSGAEVVRETARWLNAKGKRSARFRCCCTGRSAPNISSPRCPRAFARSPCSIATRSRARRWSPCTPMSSASSPTPSPPGAASSCLG